MVLSRKSLTSRQFSEMHPERVGGLAAADQLMFMVSLLN
jgi:hypothetical protein